MSKISSFLLMLVSGVLTCYLSYVTIAGLYRGFGSDVLGVCIFAIINGLTCYFSWRHVSAPVASGNGSEDCRSKGNIRSDSSGDLPPQ
jgi:hypothetical protein